MTVEQAIIWAGGICGALSAIGVIVGKLLKPYSDLKSRVEALEKTAAENREHIRSDLESLQKQERFNYEIISSLKLLLEHGATGNHNADMANKATELDDFCTKKPAN